MHVLLRVKYLILAITSNNMVTKEGVFWKKGILLFEILVFPWQLLKLFEFFKKKYSYEKPLIRAFI